MKLAKEDESSENLIMLPIRKEQIGDFVMSLLGQPQSIERETTGIFKIDHRWIINLLQIVNQRITQQNESTVVDVLIEIGYFGNTKRVIHSLNELVHFEETRFLVTKYFSININYVVKFPRKQLPEKQQIYLYIDTEGLKIANSIVFPIKIANSFKGIIRYRISSTERTWADDIDKIFDSEISKVLERKTIWRYLLNIFILFIAYVGSLGSLTASDFVGKMIINNRKEKLLNEVLNNSMSLDLSLKVDYLYRLSIAEIDHIGRNPILYILSIGFSFVVLYLGMHITLSHKPCFIILTSEDAKDYKEKNKRNKLRLILWILGLIGSLAGGVISNYLYYLLFNK